MASAAAIVQAQKERARWKTEVRHRLDAIEHGLQILASRTQAEAELLASLEGAANEVTPPPAESRPRKTRRAPPTPQRPQKPSVAPPAAEKPAEQDSSEAGADEGWLMSCDAAAPPHAVSRALRSYLGGIQLETVELSAGAFDSADAFKARLADVLRGKQIRLNSAASGSVWWVELQHALVELCFRNVLFLLRPKQWDKGARSLAAHFVFQLNEAFVQCLEAERPSGEVAVVLFGWPSDSFLATSSAGATINVSVSRLPRDEPFEDVASKGEEGAAGVKASDAAGGAEARRQPEARGAAPPPAEAAEEGDGDWLFSCKPGTGSDELLSLLGMSEAECTLIELRDIPWADAARAAPQLLDFFNGWLGERHAPPAPGEEWQRLRQLLARVFERHVILFVRDVALQKGKNKPAGRWKSAMTFAHCVSLAYDDMQANSQSDTEDRIVALVLEGWGSSRRVQGTWSDGSPFDHAVTAT